MKRPGKNRIVIGIDPGSIHCGYGIIESRGKNSFNYIGSGTVSLKRSSPLDHRLRELYENLLEIIQKFKPHEAIVEKVFFAKGIKAALTLGHARGIALLAATMEHLKITEYSALEVKKSVVGYGRADKEQVKAMVRTILNLQTPLTDDSSDALALALCHLQTLKIDHLLQGA